MTITGRQLAEFALKCLEDGVRYWYGTYYKPCGLDLYERKKAQYPSHYGSSRTSAYMEDIDAGAMCCDCVGLIKGAVWSELGTREAKYATNGCPDKSANGMFQYCIDKGMEHGKMDSFPDEPGLLLHKNGHVGVSIGGGLAVEAKGFADDMVQAAVEGRGWTGWARLPFIEYGGESSAVEAQPRKLGERTLRRGHRGEDVRQLQRELVELGYDCGSYGPNKDGVDGDFGYATEAAVKAFQRDADVTIDGVYGPESHAAMLAALDAEEWPGEREDGSPEDGGEPATYRVTLYGVDAQAAYELLERYDGEIEPEDGAEGGD